LQDQFECATSEMLICQQLKATIHNHKPWTPITNESCHDVLHPVSHVRVECRWGISHTITPSHHHTITPSHHHILAPMHASRIKRSDLTPYS
jgi:hypothetical protein